MPPGRRLIIGFMGAAVQADAFLSPVGQIIMAGSRFVGKSGSEFVERK